MSDLISRSEVFDILDRMQFFQGQRAGRELWNDKPIEVQEKDLDSFNKGIRLIRDYILQLEGFKKTKESIDEDTKLIVDEEGLMYRVVTGEKARKIADRALEVVNKRIEEMRGKEQV